MPSLLIGVDEAGYGPSLGPLSVAATAWRVDDDAPPRAVDLYERLADAVSPAPAAGRVALADSKRLYQSGGGVGALELGVLSLVRPVAATWRELVERLGVDPVRATASLPWLADYDPALPVAASADDLFAAGALVHSVAERARCRPVAVAARMVFPEEFNTLVERWGSKGAALSHTTLALVRRMLDACRAGNEPTLVVCDKHGGRNRYGALAQEHFPERWVETLHESRAESRYRIGAVEVDFRARGEASLPTAAASMTAKLLRELAMAAENRFWVARVPGLRPTAGYPVDAQRFRRDVAEARRRLGIADRTFWRDR